MTVAEQESLPFFDSGPPVDDPWRDDKFDPALDIAAAAPAAPSGPRYCAFDLEISQPVEGSDWKDQRPLGISCAATLDSDGDLVLWHAHPSPGDNDAPYPDRMNPLEVHELAGYLLEMQARDYPIVTFNGLSFDFDILAEECQNEMWAEEVAKLAMTHIDPGFQMHCQMGYMTGLAKLGNGLGVGEKTEGMHGDLAPVLWCGWPDEWTQRLAQGDEPELRERWANILSLGGTPGTRAAQELCLTYVGRDAELTAQVYVALIKQRHVYWTTQRGTRSRYPWRPEQNAGRLLTVNEALKLPVPDTSWMSNPRPRYSFFEWTTNE